MKLVQVVATALSNPPRGRRQTGGSAGPADDLPVEFGLSEGGGRVYWNVRISTVNTDGNRTSSGGQSFRWEWSGIGTKIHVCHAWVAAALKLPALSEHMMPFILAAIAG